jgi:hypothetical protein
MYVFWNYFKNAANPEWLIQLFTRESDIGGRYECEDGTSFWTVDRNDEGGRLWGRDLGSLRYVWVLPPGKTENYMLKYCKFIGREVYDIGDYPDSLSHTRGIRRHLHI